MYINYILLVYIIIYYCFQLQLYKLQYAVLCVWYYVYVVQCIVTIYHDQSLKLREFDSSYKYIKYIVTTRVVLRGGGLTLQKAGPTFILGPQNISIEYYHIVWDVPPILWILSMVFGYIIVICFNKINFIISGKNI